MDFLQVHFLKKTEKKQPEMIYKEWGGKNPAAKSRLESADRTYCNFGWQTGDFPHFYAAIISTLKSNTKVNFIIPFEKEHDKGVLLDLSFALERFCNQEQKFVTVLVFENVGRAADRKLWEIIEASTSGSMGQNKQKIYGPMEATEHASEFVKKMKGGSTFTPAWQQLTRGNGNPLFQAYADACRKFSEDFFKSSQFSNDNFRGKAKFVCIWDRVVPLKGGANPQYNSSEAGNQQLCEKLLKDIPDLKAIFLVGTGFSSHTKKNISKVFDMGKFWEALPSIKGRLRQNGFFDYMTAMYNCDVVHVGMKSGGMDALGLLGQKVVFIETVHAHELIQERIEYFHTKHITFVDVHRLPSPEGKAIESIRYSEPIPAPQKGFLKPITSTIPKERISEVETLKATKSDKFGQRDLAMITAKVTAMFSS
ncbi:hypothetical protein F2P44_22870 [Massilia sp. CCM 8695]|uniref:Glycosyltransferase family 1 protein n=1 Tax=Massilia frigida TaxID=2609281 RepID=A0ABX0N9V7_9BURK|nr:hypothetical protein [Massilia frigida]NHZ82098.1 hypothetical protein [Massilia frigida]